MNDDDATWIGPNQPLTKYKAHPNGSYYTNWQEAPIVWKKGSKFLTRTSHGDQDVFFSLADKFAYTWVTADHCTCNDKLDIVQDCWESTNDGKNKTYFYLCEFDFYWIE